MDLQLHHIGIAVEDIAQAAEDYRRRLGCARETLTKAPDVPTVESRP